MSIINYISIAIVPIIITLIILFALKEKIKIFDTFIEGANEGIKIIYKLFPTLIGIFFAVGVLRSSGVIEIIIKYLEPIISIFKIPSEIMPLMFIRPISGSASMAVATDIMKQYGVDNKIGLIASTIMGSTETTLYTIAVYTSCIGIKKIRFVLAAALIADIVGMIISVIFCSFMS